MTDSTKEAGYTLSTWEACLEIQDALRKMQAAGCDEAPHLFQTLTKMCVESNWCHTFIDSICYVSILAYSIFAVL